MAYFGTMVALTGHFYVSFAIYFCIIAYFYGMCRFSMAFAADIEHWLRCLQREIELSDMCPLAAQRMIHEIIQFHVDIRQFVSSPFQELS